MNNDRRRRLSEVERDLIRLITITDSVLDDEEDAMYNMPEPMTSSIRYEQMEEARDNLESAVGDLESALDHIREARK